MGATLIKMINRKHTNFTVLPREKPRTIVLEVSSVNPPEYDFKEFVLKCENLQRIKMLLESKIRTELKQWSLKSSSQDISSHEHKKSLYQFIKYFKSVQEEQNRLIQKEKLRFEMIKAEFDETVIYKMRNRLKYFIELNKDHEEIIYRLKEATESYKVEYTHHTGVSSDGRKKRLRVITGNNC
ncbi:uncharacterized protein LOC101238082 [Hydra vulgaris]|uniref:Uncharacterized protein LOC101238082 n=1 Tax=Hydra vulgaris TaxID=6087 RepID=A0ABM4BF19_HYDVU